MKKLILATSVISAIIMSNISLASTIDISPEATGVYQPISVQLTNQNILEKINYWGLPIDIDQKSILNVYTLIGSFEPLFKNLPETVVTDNGISLEGENARYYSILKNILLTSSGERTINIILKQYIFHILYEIGDRNLQSVDVRMLTEMDNNPNVIYNYYNEFIETAKNNKFSIEINYDTNISSGQKDNNHNRTKLYSILNAIPFLLNVPDKFNKGIFDRTNNSTDLLINNKYDISYYENNDFLNKRILFNSIYFKKILGNIEKNKRKEIKNVFPIVYEDSNLDVKGLFIDAHKYYEKGIYINTKPSDIEGQKIKTTYFLLDTSYNVQQDDISIYILSDYANITTSLNAGNVTIYPLNSSLRANNLTNDINFKNTIILNSNFIGKVEIENNPSTSATVNIILPDTFRNLFAYDYVNDHLFIKNQNSIFKITKNTIMSYQDYSTSFDQIVLDRAKMEPEKTKIQYILQNNDIK